MSGSRCSTTPRRSIRHDAGAMQIAIASVEALVSDAFKGGKFRIIASVTQLPPHFIIAQPEIKTLQDLRGKRFGVLSLHEGTTYFVQDWSSPRHEARRHHHRCGRRRADPLEAPARTQDRRRPAAVPAQL